MTVTVLKQIKFNICKSIFLSNLPDKNTLPQIAKFNEHTANLDLTSVIINDGYCSLTDLDDKIIVASKLAKNYLYIAVNKFYIYSTVDLPRSNNEYDSMLVQHCFKLIKNQFKLVNSTIRIDDHGQLGNFVHPVTTLLLKRYD